MDTELTQQGDCTYTARSSSSRSPTSAMRLDGHDAVEHDNSTTPEPGTDTDQKNTPTRSSTDARHRRRACNRLPPRSRNRASLCWADPPLFSLSHTTRRRQRCLAQRVVLATTRPYQTDHLKRASLQQRQHRSAYRNASSPSFSCSGASSLVSNFSFRVSDPPSSVLCAPSSLLPLLHEPPPLPSTRAWRGGRGQPGVLLPPFSRPSMRLP